MSEVPNIKLPEIKNNIKFGKIHIKRSEAEARRPMSTNLPLWLQGATPPRPDHGDPLSTIGQACKRSGFQPPVPCQETLKKFTRFVRLWLKKDSGFKPLTNDTLMSFEEWIAGVDYPEARKNELKRIWTESDGKVPIKIHRRDRRNWNTIKSFIKDETYPEYKYPRGINSRVDIAKCFFGPIVQSISDVVFKNPYFIKKIPVCDRAVYITERLLREGALYDFTDATSFEASFTPQLQMTAEYELFKFFCKDTHLWNDLRHFLVSIKAGKNKCQYKHISVTMDGVRMSGEMDTSLSNGFFNLMAYLFLSYQNGADHRQIVGFVEGDDGLFRSTGYSPSLEDYARLGVLIKIGQTRQLSEASFCGQVYDIFDRVVVTDPVEVLARLGWTNKKYVNASPKTLLQLLRARGFSLVYQYAGCPLLDVIGRRILELTNGVDIEERIFYGMDAWEREKLRAATAGTLPPVRPVGPDTRALVEKLYGISIETQLDLEASFRKLELWQPFNLGPVGLPVVWENFYETYSWKFNELDPSWLNRSSVSYVRELMKFPQVHKAIRGYLLP